jgi:hypothetical protein
MIDMENESRLRRTRRILSAVVFSVSCFLGGLIPARAQENVWEFMPSVSLFRPLLADPREAHLGFVRTTSHGRWEVSLGQVLDIVQSPTDRQAPLLGRPFYSESRRWAWGLITGAFARLDQQDASFLMRDNDWMLGTYFSTMKAIQSKSDPGLYLIYAARLEYTHVSSHLGDSLIGERPRLVYSRESVRGLFSVEATARGRIYLGLGAIAHSIPQEPSFFTQAGVELFGPERKALLRPVRPFLAYDLKYKREAGRGFNQSLRLGLQWRRSPDRDSTSFRFHLGYDRGRSDWGQFYRDWEERWSVGLSFDP